MPSFEFNSRKNNQWGRITRTLHYDYGNSARFALGGLPKSSSQTLLQTQSALNFAPMLRENFTFTKRQLGILMLLAGILGTVGILAIDLLHAGNESGIGPAQMFALGIMVLVGIIGLTLIPLGNDPA